MSDRDLAAELVAFLADREEATLDECARGIRSRSVEVRRTLRSDERFSRRLTAERGLPERYVYSLAAGGQKRGDGRGRPLTHKARVLALLSDGKAHSHHELYGLHVVAHSRIADLRRDGHRIRQWREGDLYLYQLETDLLDERDATRGGGHGASRSSSSAGCASGTNLPGGAAKTRPVVPGLLASSVASTLCSPGAASTLAHGPRGDREHKVEGADKPAGGESGTSEGGRLAVSPAGAALAFGAAFVPRDEKGQGPLGVVARRGTELSGQLRLGEAA